MNDTLYKPEDVDAESKSIFEQLRAEFGSPYEIWRHVEDPIFSWFREMPIQRLASD